MRFSSTGILQKKTMWFIGVEVEQETSAPPSKKNPGSAPDSERATSSFRYISEANKKVLKNWPSMCVYII